jgi:hypothetical protein
MLERTQFALTCLATNDPRRNEHVIELEFVLDEIRRATDAPQSARGPRGRRVPRIRKDRGRTRSGSARTGRCVETRTGIPRSGTIPSSTGVCTTAGAACSSRSRTRSARSARGGSAACGAGTTG